MSTYYYLTRAELEQAAQRYGEYYPDHAAASILIADHACRNELMIPYTNDLTTWIQMGERVDWLYNPSRDPEFTWGVNRHWHMLDLGKAYLMTKDEKYVQAFKEHFRSWREQNPPPSPRPPYEAAVYFQLPGPWRLLETGLRVQSWISAYAYMQSSRLLDEDFFTGLQEALEQHADYLSTYLGDTNINHAIMHMQGLFMIGVFLAEHPKAPYWRQLAMERLQLCQYHQIGPEGIQTELTTHYHDGSIEMFGTPYLLGRLAGHPFPEAYGQQLHRMTSFTLAMIRPDNRSTAIGDSEWVSNGRARVAILGGILDDEELTMLGEVSPDFLWMLGAEAFQRLVERQEHGYSPVTGKDFPQTGYYIMKNVDQHLFFDAAPMGGAHGHADALNLEWYWRRQLIFADPGRYTYEEGEWRHYFKSTAAHNTVLIDGMDQTPYVSTQAWGEPLAECTTHRRESTAAYEFVDASHNGYLRLSNPLLHRRWLLMGKEVPLLLLVDWLDGEGGHQAEQRFHLHPDAAAVLIEAEPFPGVQIDYSLSSIGVQMYWTADAAATATELKPEIVIGQGWVSEIYGSKEETSIIAAKLITSGSAGLSTVVLPHDLDGAAEEPWLVKEFTIEQTEQQLSLLLQRAKQRLWIRIESGSVFWELE
ncbi:alginate lyase family protein [Paenibacillus sp. FSL H8-0537]|uniref:alginate lyase family protein n=1 Tax=Paenibacillus sp. FSL H8-0537 TaxID=2921399 RepID=UPI0031010A65